MLGFLVVALGFGACGARFFSAHHMLDEMPKLIFVLDYHMKFCSSQCARFFNCCSKFLNILCMVLAFYTLFCTRFFSAHHMLDEMSKWTFVLDNNTVLGFLLVKLVHKSFVQLFAILSLPCIVLGFVNVIGNEY